MEIEYIYAYLDISIYLNYGVIFPAFIIIVIFLMPLYVPLE